MSDKSREELLARKAANEARRDEAMAANARFAAERPDLTVYVLHGEEPGTIRGVFGSLESAQAVAAPGEWHRHGEDEWVRGPGPDAGLSISMHPVWP